VGGGGGAGGGRAGGGGGGGGLGRESREPGMQSTRSRGGVSRGRRV